MNTDCVCLLISETFGSIKVKQDDLRSLLSWKENGEGHLTTWIFDLAHLAIIERQTQ